MARTFEERNKSYLAFKAKNPDASFAEFSAEGTLANIAAGHPMPQLGPKLTKYENWWEAGLSAFESYVKRFSIRPDSRVMDYGCGTLRVGGHFIRYLDPGNYFGLDVDGGLHDVGRELIGAALVAQKAPRLGVISRPQDMEDGVGFGADIVYSSSVCYHVHPDEAPLYFRNLQRLTGKPGATLFFSSAVDDKPAQTINLVQPVSWYQEMLSGLEFVKFHNNGQRHAQENDVRLGLMEFRAP